MEAHTSPIISNLWHLHEHKSSAGWGCLLVVESASTAKTTFQACGIINGGTYVIDKARAFKRTLPACDIVSDEVIAAPSDAVWWFYTKDINSLRLL